MVFSKLLPVVGPNFPMFYAFGNFILNIYTKAVWLDHRKASCGCRKKLRDLRKSINVYYNIYIIELFGKVMRVFNINSNSITLFHTILKISIKDNIPF